MSFTITIPMHPPQSLRANAGSPGSWRPKVKATREFKRYVKMLAIAELSRTGSKPPRWLKAKLSVTWFATGKIAPDPTNILYSLKAAIDGIEAAGIVANDRGLWSDRPVIKYGCSTKKIELTIEEEI